MIIGINIIILIVVVIFLVFILYISVMNTIKGDNIETFKKYLDTKNDKKSTHVAIKESLEKNDFKKIEVNEKEMNPISLRSKEAELIKDASLYSNVNSKNNGMIRIWLNKVLLAAKKSRNKDNIASLKIKSKILSTIEKTILVKLFRGDKKDKSL